MRNFSAKFEMPKHKHQTLIQQTSKLSVRHLSPGSGTSSTEFLWLASSWVGNQKFSVVFHQNFLNLTFSEFFHMLLVESDNGSGKGHSKSVDLSSVTTTSDSHSNIILGKSVHSEQKNWLQDFLSQKGWLNQVNWGTINSNATIT